ncbi:MAG: spermidine synthase [Terriglobia bacterium]
MLPYLLAIFASAFLLFLVEPMIAKVLLPWFGGAASVWTTCLLFFQAVLLLGYLYAHGLVSHVRPRYQAWIHLAVLAASALALLPLHRLLQPGTSWAAAGHRNPALGILAILAVTVGMPYFALSATSPLLQAWYTRQPPAGSTPGPPYRLFALSNAGSMLALVSYPLAVEPLVSLRHQLAGWLLAFVGAAVPVVAIALGNRPPAVDHQPPSADRRPPATNPPDWKLKLLWVALAACASTLLLAITNHLSQNVAAIPFLWVLPLGLYLLSFILCFERAAWYRRGLFLRLLALSLAGMGCILNYELSNIAFYWQIPLFSAGLFVCCMVCHGELARLKPHATYLTGFYLMVSLGGALGGVFVGLLAPMLFKDFWELPIGLAACAVLVLVVLHRDPASIFYGARWRPAWLAALTMAAALVVGLAVMVYRQSREPRLMVRNFYGVLRVLDSGLPPDQAAASAVKRAKKPARDQDRPKRKLMNGTITHGVQWLLPEQRRLPTTYYGTDSGVGLALREATHHGRVRAGVIGLGAGTLAAYGRPGDEYIFYEINPLVIRLANSEFTFLHNSPARVSVVEGDARLSLEEEPPQGFDVLAVDAFSGDAIPVHLLTREAFTLYFRHLQPSGVIAVHTSNRYVDLEPVVQALAASLGKNAMEVDSQGDDNQGTENAIWILVSGRKDFFADPDIQEAAVELDNQRPLRLWTDDYSNLITLLK